MVELQDFRTPFQASFSIHFERVVSREGSERRERQFWKTATSREILSDIIATTRIPVEQEHPRILWNILFDSIRGCSVFVIVKGFCGVCGNVHEKHCSSRIVAVTPCIRQFIITH